MKTIDIHAHLVPQSLWQAVAAGRDWHGYRHQPGEGLGTLQADGKRTAFSSPKVRFTPEERIADMNAQGVDVQVVSIHTPFFGHHLEPAQGLALAREVNDEIAEMTRRWPERFAGLATLPVQDVKAAIAELERAVTVLGLKGAELDTQVNGEQWDEPKFLPFFKAAEAMGAVLFFHPQPQHNFLMQRTPRDGLFNSLGVILDDAIVVAILIAGGVLEACPNLKAWSDSEPAQRVPAAPLLRHRRRQRKSAALPPGRGGRRPRGARQRLAVRAVASLARGVGAGAEEPDAGREGPDRLSKPRDAARRVATTREEGTRWISGWRARTRS